MEVLMVSFGLAGGSFAALKNIAEIPHQKLHFTILGLGNYENTSDQYKVVAIPYMRYDGTWGHLASKYSLLGFLLQLPLYTSTILYILKHKPSLIVFNGLATMLPLVIFTKLIGIKSVLSFRSWWDHDRFKAIEWLVKIYCRQVDLCYANSIGTKKNLTQIIDEKKIKVVSHHANSIYFQHKNRLNLKKRSNVLNKFVILYVGRIDEEKHCDFMIQMIKHFEKNNQIKFLFAGEGRLKDEIIELEKKQANVQYLGFISSAQELSDIYTTADVLLSNADETYFARPAVEALASGTPVMIFRVPAIGEKILKNIEVPDSMVPMEIGWIIDHRKKDETIKLIQSLSTSNLAENMRTSSQTHAKKYYSKDPNIELQNDFVNLIEH